MIDGDAQFERLCELGRQAAQNIDSGRYFIGDLALEVQKAYKRDTIGRFAKEIGVPKSRVAEYRTVAKFWEKSARAYFAEVYDGQVSYTHLRLAMRLKDPGAAFEFVRECGENSYTCEQAAVTLKKQLGQPTPPPKLLDGLGLVIGLRGDIVTLRVDSELTTALYDAMRSKTPVSIVIRPSEDEPDFKPVPAVLFGSGYERRMDTRLVKAG